MKNKILNILALFAVLAFFSSCEDRLALEPEQSLSEDAAFANAAAAESVLLGVYSQAQLIEIFGSQPQIVEDYMSDNTNFVGSFPTLQELNNFSAVAPNVSIQSWWQVHYRAINAANTLIERVPGIDDPALTAERAARIIAEAKFLRAILYFHMVNLWGQPYAFDNGASLGVPLVTEGFTGEITLPARSTVAEVHAQIRQDLVEALPDLPASYANGAQTRGRATQGAANGYLGRLHLYRGEYAEAAQFSAEVLNSPLYALAPDLSFYNQLTSEDVFTIVNSAIDNPRTGAGGWASYHRPASQGGRGDCPFTQDLVDAMGPDDLRLTQLSDLVTDAAGNAGVRMTTKFPDAATNADNAPLMRVAEVMLNRAEALAELNGVNQESLDLVNPIRERAGLSVWTTADFTSGAEFVEAILEERRKELCFEGHRRCDLLRRGKGLRSEGPFVEAAAFGAPRTILPIPQREIDINPNLVQNAGY
jgi:starch-binding outer membrane protein, SusD/RagB family